MKPRIVPDKHMCHKHGNQIASRIETKEKDPRVTTPIIVIVTLGCGDQRYFGVDKAWISSHLQMCVSGGFINTDNELVKDWKISNENNQEV